MTATVESCGAARSPRNARAGSRQVHWLVRIGVLVLAVGAGGCSAATRPGTFVAPLASTGEADVSGEAEFTFDGTKVNYVIDLGEVDGLMAAHLHHEPSKLVIVTLIGADTPRGDSGRVAVEGTFTAADLNASSPVTFEELVRLMRTGEVYVNAHTQANPGGAIRGAVSAAAPDVSRAGLRSAAAQPAEAKARPAEPAAQPAEQDSTDDDANQLPDSVTPAMIEEGETIFNGAGLCSSCHGENGVGTQLAPNLGDTEWLNIDGSYEAIVELIGTGVPEPKQAMVPMPPRGGSQITDEELRAAAAYVWSLCRSAQDEGGAVENCDP